MRKTLLDLVKSAIIYEYSLPNKEHSIEPSPFSTAKDTCFSQRTDNDIAEIIYNGIVEYAINEYDINYDDICTEHLRAMAENIRYNEDATNRIKISYGFYGEVLLYAILYAKYNTNVLISKGYFYDPLEKAEAKGYDAYHLIQRENKVQLWFGEAKFRVDYKKSITEVISNLNKALSENYFKKNVLSISKKKHNISNGSDVIDLLKPITENWRHDVSIVIADELKKNNITLVYPVLIAYEKKKRKDYHDNIKECIKHIKDLYATREYNLSTDIDVKFFFMFLPVDNVKEIKESVVEWISTKKPLI